MSEKEAKVRIKINKLFTMLELIVAVTIISIMVAVSVPRLAGFYKGTKLNASARQLAALFNYTRELAIVEKRACRVLYDEDLREFQILIQKDPVNEPDEYVFTEGRLGILKLPHGVDLILDDDNDGSSEIDPEKAAGGTVYNLQNDEGAEIQVSIKPGSGRAVIITQE